ncbi:MAG: helix-turn-helix domain-containing protein [Candidatus Limnocylindria bacterium]
MKALVGPVGQELRPKPFYTPTDLAHIFDVDPSTIMDWIHRGSLYAIKLGPKTYRIPLAVVLSRIDPERTRPTRVQIDAADELRADERKLARRAAPTR